MTAAPTPAVAPRPVVEIAQLSKTFGVGPTKVPALIDIDLTIGTGEVVGLIGPSGSGKSTLLNCIGCITEPDSGAIRLDGRAIFDGKWLIGDLRRLRLETIGFIFQFHNLLPFLSAWENVAIVRALMGESPERAKARAMELLGSGKALAAMERLIDAQGRRKEQLEPAKLIHEVRATNRGTVTAIDCHLIARIARLAGAPMDKGAGIDLLHKVGASVRRDEALYRIHAESETGLGYARELALASSGYTVTP